VGVLLVAAGIAIAFSPGRPTDVLYCSGPDVSRTQRRSVGDFNKSSEGDKVTAVANFAFPDDADGQRRAYRQAMQARKCDVVYMDIAYMPEFASAHLLSDMTSYLRNGREQRFDEQMMQTVKYEDRLWGVPKQLDGGVLFYRSDKVPKPPGSWQDVFRASIPGIAPASGKPEKPGLRLPLEMYEGLTVVVLELAYAAGANSIVDGGRARVDQPEVLEVLKALRDAIADRALPRTGVDSKETGTLDVFRIGNAKFMRNWVVAESRITDEIGRSPILKRIAGRIKIVSLPPWKGGARVGILGGHDLVIPRSSKNPDGALKLVSFLTSDEQLRRDALKGSLAPPLDGWTSDESIQGSPALVALAATDLRLRPLIPQYARVSREIGDTVGRLLDVRGRAQAPDDAALQAALSAIDRRVQELLTDG
jgi:multiple sugar transport system substrate-binding protein